MRNAITIKRDPNIKLNSYIKTYLNPEHIFLPIEKGSKLRVKDNAYVYKNDIVMIDKNGCSIHSTISGNVLGVKEVLYSDGIKKPSVIIANDFKENVRIRKSVRKRINDYTKEEFLRILEDVNIRKNGEQLVNLFGQIHDNIVINAIEKEPYFGKKYFILNNGMEEILETIDYLIELFNVKSCSLAIKNTDSDVITRLIDLLGTYPNILLNVMEDEYPLGIDSYLKEVLKQEDALVLDIEDIMNIHHVLKRELPVSSKLITVTGDAVEPRSVVEVKIGTLLSEVFINNFNFIEKNVDVYLNGKLTGVLITTLNYVIDDNVDGIIVMKKEDNANEECVNCGLCQKVCPKNLDPKYVSAHKGRVKPEYKKGCIQCGLCNYFCPSKIDLKKYMEEK